MIDIYTISFDANGGTINDSDNTRVVQKIDKYNTYDYDVNIYDSARSSDFSSLHPFLSNNIFSISLDNTSGTDVQYANFFTKPSNKIVSGGFYTYVV